MAYATSGLKALMNAGDKQIWELLTVDSLATATGSGYITDASTAGSGKGAAGRGMKLGDIVYLYSGVDSVSAMTSITKFTTCYVSAISSSTGYGTITVEALS